MIVSAWGMIYTIHTYDTVSRTASTRSFVCRGTDHSKFKDKAARSVPFNGRQWSVMKVDLSFPCPEVSMEPKLHCHGKKITKLGDLQVT
jgi:hypothetical protein